MKKEYHQVDPEHLRKMQTKFAHLQLPDKFMLLVLNYPFFFLAQRIEHNVNQTIYFNNLCKFDLKPKIKRNMNLFRTIRAIYDGNRNIVYKKEDIEQLAEQRLAICRECPLYTRLDDTQGGGQPDPNSTNFHEYCDSRKTVTITSEGKTKTFKGCGCPLSSKTRSPQDTCPMGKWQRASINVDNTANVKSTEDINNWQKQDNETSV